jgi:iron(III) transport system ATP-binding protein
VKIALTNIARRFGERQVLRGLSLTVEPGTFLGLLGDSGSGKTTTLRIIAGLERPDQGTVELDDKVMDDGRRFIPPDQRTVGLVFQDLALWPHLTAAEHLDLIARPLRLSREKRRARVDQWLERCRLTDCRRQRPDQLSGGEQQRLALARTLLPEPGVLLLDEPFTGCDRPLVGAMKKLVGALHRERGLTTILVSHDVRHLEELVSQVALLRDGNITAVGSPSALKRTLDSMR